ncbi:hypothetical protein M569_17629 [Genlisea aurea]|uniref:Uncharacterized protein n=1 Tax=Genlisea aurea TaxID=192259 RepID=S8DCV3_9LAMI|nr:hypothetical protein M569_17629 [Genlisea aurea]
MSPMYCDQVPLWLDALGVGGGMEVEIFPRLSIAKRKCHSIFFTSFLWQKNETVGFSNKKMTTRNYGYTLPGRRFVCPKGRVRFANPSQDISPIFEEEEGTPAPLPRPATAYVWHDCSKLVKRGGVLVEPLIVEGRRS